MAIAQMKRVPGTLIVAGIGTEASFEALLKMLGGLPKRVIVAEPAETRGGKSVQALEGLDGVTIVDGVLADGSGEVELVQYNLPGLRGLTAPTPALKALFPGLKERNRVTVRKVALASVVGNAGELPNPVRLRIDLPGAEPMALKALEDGGILAKADLVSMRCGAEAMFDGGWPRAQLQDWLQARYIRLEHAADDDPDWPDLRLKADATGRKLATLEAENAKLKATWEALLLERDATRLKVSDLEKRLESARSEAAAAAERQAARIKALEIARDEVITERYAAQAARDHAAGERDGAVAARDQLQTECDAARSKILDLEERFESVRSDASAASERQAARIKALEIARDEVITERDAAQAERDHSAGERDDAVAARDTLQAERDKLMTERTEAYVARDKAMADLGVAIRMQGLLQTDLDDLRERYRQSETARSQQEDLLRKLTPRLQEAAQQLRQLQLVEAADAELLAPKATRARPRATPARKRTSRKKSADAQ